VECPGSSPTKQCLAGSHPFRRTLNSHMHVCSGFSQSSLNLIGVYTVPPYGTKARSGDINLSACMSLSGRLGWDHPTKGPKSPPPVAAVFGINGYNCNLGLLHTPYADLGKFGLCHKIDAALSSRNKHATIYLAPIHISSLPPLNCNPDNSL
jgi:hypothetical protein